MIFMKESMKFKSGKKILTWPEGRSRDCKKSAISVGDKRENGA